MASAVVAAGNPAGLDYRAAVAGRATLPSPVEVALGELHGMPAAIISDEAMELLAKPFEFTLVGKFFCDRPPLVEIRKFIVRMKFCAFVKVDKHDMRHVVFRFADERDYMRLFARRTYRVSGIEMRVTKWSPFFDISDELPIVPLWISFPGMRYQLYHPKTLMDIARIFGKPLCVDSNTASQDAMVQARVLVEVDVSVNHPEKIWIGSQGKGRPQQVIIEKLPSFCEKCKKVGHLSNECGGSDVILPQGIPRGKSLYQWVPKLVASCPVLEGSPPVMAPPGLICNHSGPSTDPNLSHYSDYVQLCRADGFRQGSGDTSSKPLTDIINEIVGGGEGNLNVKAGDPLDYGSNSIETPILSPPDPPDPSMVIPDPILVISGRTPAAGLSEEPSQGFGAFVVGDSGQIQVCEHDGRHPILSAVHSPKMADGGIPNSAVISSNLFSVPSMGLESPIGDPPSLEGVSSLGNSANCDGLVDVQVSLGGRFSLLVEEDGEFVTEEGKFEGPAGKGGNKMLFSNVLKFGKVASPPSLPRVTRSKTKEKLLPLEEGEGWILSKNGKTKGVCGPRAVALNALLNPQN